MYSFIAIKYIAGKRYHFENDLIFLTDYLRTSALHLVEMNRRAPSNCEGLLLLFWWIPSVSTFFPIFGCPMICTPDLDRFQ